MGLKLRIVTRLTSCLALVTAALLAQAGTYSPAMTSGLTATKAVASGLGITESDSPLVENSNLISYVGTFDAGVYLMYLPPGPDSRPVPFKSHDWIWKFDCYLDTTNMWSQEFNTVEKVGGLRTQETHPIWSKKQTNSGS